MSFSTPVPGLPPLPRSRADNSALSLLSDGQGYVVLTEPMKPPGRVGLRITRGDELIVDDPAGDRLVYEPAGDLIRLACRIHSDQKLPPGQYVFWLLGETWEGNRLVTVPSTPFSTRDAADTTS